MKVLHVAGNPAALPKFQISGAPRPLRGFTDAIKRGREGNIRPGYAAFQVFIKVFDHSFFFVIQCRPTSVLLLLCCSVCLDSG